LDWPPYIQTIRDHLRLNDEAYLVGGAVRDVCLDRALHDIDLAIPQDGRSLARHLANSLGGAYYTLDAERGVGRALFQWEGSTITIDVAQFRGDSLQEDLQKRDFTVNAMAVDLRGDLQNIIDPLGGLEDLYEKKLRRCSTSSISDDPVRMLRAVRASVTHNLLIEPATRQDLKRHSQSLSNASPERVRDEFFNILGGKKPVAALETLFRLQLLPQIVPDVTLMSTIEQGPPHQHNLWQHTLAVIEYLDIILQVITPRRDENLTANIQAGLVAWTLDSVRESLQHHLAQMWPNQRSHRALLIFAALLHDVGKLKTRSVGDDGRVHFYEHERLSAEFAEKCADDLRLSRHEIDRLTTVVREHMRPHWLASTPLTPRAVYRFWRHTGSAGVDICLLAIADYLGTYGVTLDSKKWTSYLEVPQTLLIQYFVRREASIDPPALITGEDLLRQFQLQPGPQIGSILEQIREAQAVGEITTKQEALRQVERLLSNS
jgi:putative nucleotidyltransferase with HDIG domain